LDEVKLSVLCVDERLNETKLFNKTLKVGDRVPRSVIKFDSKNKIIK